MKKLWKIFTWSPFGKQPWYFHVFNSLWVWGTVVLLMLSLPSWLDAPVNFGDAAIDNTGPEVDLFDYNQPIALPNGRCMVIQTREIQPCG